MPGNGEDHSKTLLAMQRSDEAGDPFRCLICLELVYKPVVQPCGHVFCFWCIHRAMNRIKQSQCPLCRRPYIHFPKVCELLHFFLMKVAPQEYDRRAKEIQDMEQSIQIFSPRNFVSAKSLGRPYETENKQKSPGLNPLSGDEAAESMVRASREISGGRNYGSGQDEKSPDECHQLLTISDFLCSYCNKFLYRPVALNCGQVFCESCVSNSGMAISCPVCRSFHPGSSIQICLELHHYLQRAFPEDTAKRKEEILSNMAEVEDGKAETSDLVDSAEDQGQFVHAGTGCDACGMFPILGQRYRCLDCPERVGYDLCGPCYRTCKTGAELRMGGRFNQQHRLNHRMEEIPLSRLRAGILILDLNIGNGLIQQRRRLQIRDVMNNLDGYIGSFILQNMDGQEDDAYESNDPTLLLASARD